jgi:hypothetical protein
MELQLSASKDSGGSGFFVAVGSGVVVGVEVTVGVSVGVNVGPNNCPAPQPESAKLARNAKIVAVRCCWVIFFLRR